MQNYVIYPTLETVTACVGQLFIWSFVKSALNNIWWDGETSIEEHVVGELKVEWNIRLGLLGTQRHNGERFEGEVAILAQKYKTLSCITFEAFWTNFENSNLDSRKECFVITRDLTQFLKLIFRCERGIHPCVLSLSLCLVSAWNTQRRADRMCSMCKKVVLFCFKWYLNLGFGVFVLRLCCLAD